MSLLYEKPSDTLASELQEVAAAADDLSRILGTTQNFPIPETFPKDQLLEICESLMLLPNGTAEGCRSPLQYSKHRLPRIRREHVQIDSQASSIDDLELTRGSTIDSRLAVLISSVSTAWDEYQRQAAIEEEEDIPPETEVSVHPSTVGDAVAKSDKLVSRLHDATNTIDDVTNPGSKKADQLKRQLKDVQSINKMGAAEAQMPRVFAGLLHQTISSLKPYPKVIEKTTKRLRLGVDILEVAYKRWHDFKGNTVNFIIRELRETITSFDEVGEILKQQQLPQPGKRKGLPDLCIEILSENGGPLKATQIYDKLFESGLHRRTKIKWPPEKPYKRVYASLLKREQTKADVVNIGGGYWALDEWLTKTQKAHIRANRTLPSRAQLSEQTKKGMKIAREQGAPIGQRTKIGPKERELAEQLYAAGESKKIIAEKIGVSVQTISKRLPHLTWRRGRSRKSK